MLLPVALHGLYSVLKMLILLQLKISQLAYTGTITDILIDVHGPMTKYIESVLSGPATGGVLVTSN